MLGQHRVSATHRDGREKAGGGHAARPVPPTMTAPETDDPDDGKSTDEQTGEYGASTTTIGSEAAWTFVHAPDADGRAPIRVRGEWLDEEPGHVRLDAQVDGYDVRISLEPRDARALAAKITSAASYAEGDR